MSHSSDTLADPIPYRTIELGLEQVAASHTPHPAAGPPGVCAELDRLDIAK